MDHGQIVSKELLLKHLTSHEQYASIYRYLALWEIDHWIFTRGALNLNVGVLMTEKRLSEICTSLAFASSRGRRSLFCESLLPELGIPYQAVRETKLDIPDSDLKQLSAESILARKTIQLVLQKLRAEVCRLDPITSQSYLKLLE